MNLPTRIAVATTMKEKINFFIVICFLNKIFKEIKIAISCAKILIIYLTN